MSCQLRWKIDRRLLLLPSALLTSARGARERAYSSCAGSVRPFISLAGQLYAALLWISGCPVENEAVAYGLNEFRAQLVSNTVAGLLRVKI